MPDTTAPDVQTVVGFNSERAVVSLLRLLDDLRRHGRRVRRSGKGDVVGAFNYAPPDVPLFVLIAECAHNPTMPDLDYRELGQKLDNAFAGLTSARNIVLAEKWASCSPLTEWNPSRRRRPASDPAPTEVYEWVRPSDGGRVRIEYRVQSGVQIYVYVNDEWVWTQLNVSDTHPLGETLTLTDRGRNAARADDEDGYEPEWNKHIRRESIGATTERVTRRVLGWIQNSAVRERFREQVRRWLAEIESGNLGDNLSEERLFPLRPLSVTECFARLAAIYDKHADKSAERIDPFAPGMSGYFALCAKAGKLDDRDVEPAEDALRAVEADLIRAGLLPDPNAPAPADAGKGSGQTTAEAERDPLSPRLRKAWEQYQRFETLLMERGTPKPTDSQVYQAMVCDAEDPVEVPNQETWLRYVRDARKQLKKNKHNPRHGRAIGSGSIVSRQ